MRTREWEWLYRPVQQPTRLYGMQTVAEVQQEEVEVTVDNLNWTRSYSTNGDGWTIEGGLSGWDALEKL